MVIDDRDRTSSTKKGPPRPHHDVPRLRCAISTDVSDDHLVRDLAAWACIVAEQPKQPTSVLLREATSVSETGRRPGFDGGSNAKAPAAQGAELRRAHALCGRPPSAPG
jgi:hypothetical protein